MAFERKYGVAGTVDGVVLITRGAVDFKAAPTLATGDVTVSKDGGTFANVASLPTVTPTGATSVQVALSAGELTAKRVVVRFIDATATKEWEDQEIIVETCGDAAAQFVLDRSDGQRGGMTSLPSSGTLAVNPTVGGFVSGAITLAAVSEFLFTVQTDAGNTAATFKTDRAEAVTDFWKDAFAVMRNGSLAGQVKKITGYNGTTKFFTLESGFTSAPASGDIGCIINK